MLKLPHFPAAVLTILAVVVFLVLDWRFGYRFGLRTYWPEFMCLYLLVWYFVTVLLGKRAN